MRPKPSGKGTFVVVLQHEDEQWIADDGTGVVRFVIHDDQPTFPTPEDKADYEASPPGPPFPDQPVAVEDMTVAGMPAAEVRALPTDPAQLRARIEGGEVDADRDGRPAAGLGAHASRGQGRAVRGAQAAARRDAATAT